MKVLDFQQHVADLAKLIESAGSKPIANELLLIRDMLTPFSGEPLKVFADFLLRAKGYLDGGEVPMKAPAGRAPRAIKTPTPKAAAADIPALTAEAVTLYDRISAEDVTMEHVDALMTKLAPLKKDELVMIANGLDLLGMKTKTKDKISEAIREQYRIRKGATERANMTNRNNL